MKWLALFLMLSSFHCLAQNDSIPSISFGPMVIGENRIPLQASDFIIRTNGDLPVEANLQEETLQWIRYNKTLLLPRMKIVLKVPKESAARLHVIYGGKTLLFQQDKDFSFISFYFSLFDPSPISIFRQGKLASTLRLDSRNRKSAEQERTLIDYSCAPYGLNITGINNEFFSAGCLSTHQGNFGDETSTLEVLWISPDLELAGNPPAPYVINMKAGIPAQIEVEDKKGEIRTLTISANFPHRFHRLKTALGFGPYIYQSFESKIEGKRTYAFPIMLYGNLTLAPSSSIRFFDAFIYNKSNFNNAGAYFAYDLGSALDNRFKIIPLLGLQAISFRQADGGKSYSSLLYPQGFEFVYSHAFGLKNYSLVYGMFISTASSEPYKNLWIRFGRKVFGELNYISWKKNGHYAKTWGLSIGLPFFSIF